MQTRWQAGKTAKPNFEKDSATSMNANTNLPAKQEQKAIEYIPFGSDKSIKLSVKLIQDFICIPTKSGRICTDRDAMKFAMLCQSRGLNPWEGDAYLQGYDGKNGPEFSLITAHQAFLKRAELHPEFDGFSSGVVVRNADGTVSDVEGDFFTEDQEVIGGWCKVNFKTRKTPMYKRLRLSTFDKGYGVWEKNKEGMIVKCAEADALRAAFPTKCGGLYLAGEAAPDEETRFRNAKPAAGNVTSPAFLPEASPRESQSTQTDVTPVQAPAAETVTQPETITTTPQQQLEELLRAEGYGIQDFNQWGIGMGQFENELKSFSDLSDEQAAKFLKSKTGLLRGLKNGRGQ